MAENNLYDLIISELVLRTTQQDNLYTTQLKITNSLNSLFVPTGFSGSVVFTSQVLNIPLGYSIESNSHVISYPNASDTVGSSSVLTGSAVTVLMGSTYVVTSTVTLVHEDSENFPDIILNATQTITAIAPLYYGIKPYLSPFNTSNLFVTHAAATTFTMTTSTLGRLYIVMPSTNPALVSVTDYNGIVWPISDFEVVTNAGLRYYVLNYNTILLNSNQKTFTLNYV